MPLIDTKSSMFKSRDICNWNPKQSQTVMDFNLKKAEKRIILIVIQQQPGDSDILHLTSPSLSRRKKRNIIIIL